MTGASSLNLHAVISQIEEALAHCHPSSDDITIVNHPEFMTLLSRCADGGFAASTTLARVGGALHRDICHAETGLIPAVPCTHG